MRSKNVKCGCEIFCMNYEFEYLRKRILCKQKRKVDFATASYLLTFHRFGENWSCKNRFLRCGFACEKNYHGGYEKHFQNKWIQWTFCFFNVGRRASSVKHNITL